MADNRDDDITDLTGDENTEGKARVRKVSKGKDTGSPAEPGLNRPNPGKKGETVNEISDKKKGGPLKLILILLPIVLVAAFVVLLVLNLFGIRDIAGGVVIDPLISTIVWFDPGFTSVDDELRAKSDEREAELNKRETGINERDEKLAKRESEIENRESMLDSKEIQLNRRSASLDSQEEQATQTARPSLPLYRRAMTEQELADMQSLSRKYSRMTPDAAADILMELNDDRHVAAILYYMSERNASAILAVMDAEYAAKITEILLYS